MYTVHCTLCSLGKIEMCKAQFSALCLTLSLRTANLIRWKNDGFPAILMCVCASCSTFMFHQSGATVTRVAMERTMWSRCRRCSLLIMTKSIHMMINDTLETILFPISRTFTRNWKQHNAKWFGQLSTHTQHTRRWPSCTTHNVEYPPICEQTAYPTDRWGLRAPAFYA